MSVPAGVSPTGLNFVLQNVGDEEKQQQFSGLATLGRMLSGGGGNDNNRATPNSSSSQQQSPSSTEVHEQVAQELVAELREKYSSSSNNENKKDENENIGGGGGEHFNSTQRGTELLSEEEREQQEKILEEEFHHGIGHVNPLGHFEFEHARASTGEGLHRVFDFTNRTDPTATMLVPQIAPHLAANYQALHHNNRDGGSFQGGGKRKTKKLIVGGGGDQISRGGDGQRSSSSTTSTTQLGDKQNTNTNNVAPYSCYSKKGIGGIIVSNKNAHQSPSERRRSIIQQGKNAGGSSLDQQQNQFHGLHCLFEVCKEEIDEKPRRLPRLRIAGLQRNIESENNNNDTSSSSKSAATTAGDNKKDTTATESSASSPTAAASSSSPNRRLAAGGVPHVANFQVPAIHWRTPWPFEVEEQVASSGAAAKQAALLDKFVPISPIFTDVSTVAGLTGMSVAAQHQKVQTERNLQVASQIDSDVKEASDLARALSLQHGYRDERQKEHDIDGDENKNADADAENKQQQEQEEKERAEKEKAEKEKQQQQPHPPAASSTTRRNKGHPITGLTSSHPSGFLPRQFKVAPIPQVFPSLLTVTSQKHPHGIVQQQQQDNVDWTGEQSTSAAAGSGTTGNEEDENFTGSASVNTASPTRSSHVQQHNANINNQQQHNQLLLQQTTSARMRNKARNFQPGSSAGVLVPPELLMATNANYPKHRDVKKLQGKTDKLRAQLEHFKTVRRIRVGETELKEKLAGDDTEADPRNQTRRQVLYGSSTSKTARGGTSSSSQSASKKYRETSSNLNRPKTPPKSFLALHGLRGNEAIPTSPSLPPVHGGTTAQSMNSTFAGTHTSAGTSQQQQNANDPTNLTVVNHPPVPWSRQVAGSGSVSARFTHGKYTAPDRARVVAALLD